MIDIIQSTWSLRYLRIILKIVSRCKGVTVSNDADVFFSILCYFTIYKSVVLTVNDPTRYHQRCRREVEIWRSTILLVRINEETDSDERESSRSDATEERWCSAWRRQVKEMTTEEMNESSWRTLEKMIMKGQNYDDVTIIEYRENDKENDKKTHRVGDDTD